jgi:hypothetical protein
MTTQTEARAPYLSISVQLDTPDAPRLNGRPVATVSWSAIRYPSLPRVTFVVYAHYGDAAEPHIFTLLRTEATTTPDVPAWVPKPPPGWLASLKMTAEPDPDATFRAYLAREGRL